MSGEIDGHCPPLHHVFIVSRSVLATLSAASFAFRLIRRGRPPRPFPATNAFLFDQPPRTLLRFN